MPGSLARPPIDSRFAASRRPRWGTLLFVALLHLAALAGLIRVFAPDITARVIESATSLVTVTITAPPEPDEALAPEQDPGAAGAEAPKAVAREVTAPEAPLLRPSSAPRAASTGDEYVAGSGSQGAGTGAGGEGTGPGSGGARPLALISGHIDDARDYPTPPGGRRFRRGHDVVIELTIGTDGRVAACRVTDPSPDPAADAITCRLASVRFVFRPRLNDAGQPVVGIYRWRQRWF